MCLCNWESDYITKASPVCFLLSGRHREQYLWGVMCWDFKSAIWIPSLFHTHSLCPFLFYLFIYFYLTRFLRKMILWMHRPNSLSHWVWFILFFSDNNHFSGTPIVNSIPRQQSSLSSCNNVNNHVVFIQIHLCKSHKKRKIDHGAGLQKKGNKINMYLHLHNSLVSTVSEGWVKSLTVFKDEMSTILRSRQK